MTENSANPALDAVLDIMGTDKHPMQRGWDTYKLSTHRISPVAHPVTDGTYHEFFMYRDQYLNKSADSAPLHFVLKGVYDYFDHNIGRTSALVQAKIVPANKNNCTLLPYNHATYNFANQTSFFLNVGLYLKENAEKCGLQQQVEAFPEWLKAPDQRMVLGAFAEFAEAETRKAKEAEDKGGEKTGGIPKLGSLPLLGRDLAYKLSLFTENYSLKGYFTPEPLTRFVNPCGSFRKNELSVSGFNYHTFGMMHDFMTMLSFGRNVKKYPFEKVIEKKNEEVYRDLSITRELNYPVAWTDLDYWTSTEMKEEVTRAKHEASYYVYMLGLGALRWGITKKTTPEEMDVICDKMKRQLDYTLCRKEVDMLEARMDKNVSFNLCLFGKTEGDIYFLSQYTQRLEARQKDYEVLTDKDGNEIRRQKTPEVLTDAEIQLAQKIHQFFTRYPNYAAINKVEENRTLSGASALGYLEQNYSEKIMGEVIEAETGQKVEGAVNVRKYREAVLQTYANRKEASVA